MITILSSNIEYKKKVKKEKKEQKGKKKTIRKLFLISFNLKGDYFRFCSIVKILPQTKNSFESEGIRRKTTRKILYFYFLYLQFNHFKNCSAFVVHLNLKTNFRRTFNFD